MSYRFTRTKEIDKIKFGLLSPDEIRKMSAGRIITADTYDEDGLPIPSGLMDQRLGTIEPGQRCQTCGNLVSNCMGHFGHIELARPIVHVSYAKLVLKVLRSICLECSRLLISEEKKHKYLQKQKKNRKIYHKGNKKLSKKIFKSARRNRICPYCSSKMKKIILEKPTTFYEEDEEKSSRRITPIEIRERFKRILDRDLRILGINPKNTRLEWIIFTVLPIPPVCARPSITLDSGIRSEDDLSRKLIDVIRINQRLRENIEAGAPHLIVENLWELLQYHCTTYFNNQVLGIPPTRHRSGRALRTLTQRLKGKEGRFRSNLSGKRVDFSARSVISPNPYLSINEVGVPQDIARILTIPTNVNDWNIEEMKKLVLNGPNNHPGANFVIRNDRRRIDLRYVKNRKIIADMLEPGFTVERHIKNGDLVLFNRQPSLHRMSIMAHEAKIMDGKTIRLNLTVCPPYNADFDGDEMNLHVIQGIEARTEAKLLLNVQNHILSPRNGKAILGGVKDLISSIYQLTKKDSYYTEKEAMKLLYLGNLFNSDYKKDFNLNELKKSRHNLGEKYSGKDIFSSLIPTNLNLVFRSQPCLKCLEKEGQKCQEMNCPSDAYVLIKNGVLKKGTLGKKFFGAMGSESILKKIYNDYGSNNAKRFIDNSVRMLLYIIRKNGLTTGLNEFILNKKLKKEISKIIEEGKKKLRSSIEKFVRKKKVVKSPNYLRFNSYFKNLFETKEIREEIKIKLNNIHKKIEEKCIEFLEDDSDLANMIKSGARGSFAKLRQMIAMVGQQTIRDKRIHIGYERRTLPHFKRGEISLKANGFIESSLYEGLDPIEYYFHTMDGRDGLVDKAFRVSDSGYMQRRLINALQDLVVESDGTVRNSVNEIIQFRYGDDLVNPQKAENGKAVDIDSLIFDAKNLNVNNIDSNSNKGKEIREISRERNKKK